MNYPQALKWFKSEMLKTLQINGGKSGWQDLNPSELYKRIHDEVAELGICFFPIDGNTQTIGTKIGELHIDPEQIIRECTDVAIFAMFLAHNISKETFRDEA